MPAWFCANKMFQWLSRRLKVLPLAVDATVALTLAWMALRRPHVVRASQRLLVASSWWPRLAPHATPERVRAVVTAVARRLPFRTECFEQSLAVCALISRRADNAHLIIGVRRTADGFSAHAWTAATANSQDAGFVPIAQLTADGWSATPH